MVLTFFFHVLAPASSIDLFFYFSSARPANLLPFGRIVSLYCRSRTDIPLSFLFAAPPARKSDCYPSAGSEYSALFLSQLASLRLVPFKLFPLFVRA